MRLRCGSLTDGICIGEAAASPSSSDLSFGLKFCSVSNNKLHCVVLNPISALGCIPKNKGDSAGMVSRCSNTFSCPVPAGGVNQINFLVHPPGGDGAREGVGGGEPDQLPIRVRNQLFLI